MDGLLSALVGEREATLQRKRVRGGLRGESWIRRVAGVAKVQDLLATLIIDPGDRGVALEAEFGEVLQISGL